MARSIELLAQPSSAVTKKSQMRPCESRRSEGLPIVPVRRPSAPSIAARSKRRRGGSQDALPRRRRARNTEDEGKEQGFRRILVTEPSHNFTGSWWPPGHIIGYEHTFTHTVHDFLNAVATGKRVRPDFEDGVRNQLVLETIERSASSRRWLAVPAL